MRTDINPAPEPPLLCLEGVELRRGAQTVLRSLDLAVPAQAITAVVGRSGVGKSTLVAALNGLVAPAAGRIVASDCGPLHAPEALRAHRLCTATVFQDHALIERLSALDNVLLGLADQRHPLSLLPWSRALQRRAAAALDEVGLLARAHARVAQLSGGERQRVGVARALVRQPRLLLADEPFASVDPALVRQLGDSFRALVRDHGMTVVVVMHQIDTARQFADHILALADGGLAWQGPARAFDAAAQSHVFGHPSRALRSVA